MCVSMCVHRGGREEWNIQMPERKGKGEDNCAGIDLDALTRVGRERTA